MFEEKGFSSAHGIFSLVTRRSNFKVDRIVLLPRRRDSASFALRDLACQIVGLLEPFAVLFAKAAFEFGQLPTQG